MNSLPIVLTGTIVPNAVAGVSVDPDRRRQEYLAAIDFYRNYTSTIYFLENSSYDLANDAAFTNRIGVQLRKYPLSLKAERGKGYQEFEMLDLWVTGERYLPSRWLKISGRYVVKNIASILHDCVSSMSSSMVIDQTPRSQIARTQLFCVSSEFYCARLAGCFREVDDRSGRWIERILFRRLASTSAERIRFFRQKPDIRGTSGATGKSYPEDRASKTIKQLLRTLNGYVDPRYLWFSR